MPIYIAGEVDNSCEYSYHFAPMGTFFALEGCKLPSKASKEWCGAIRELRRKQERMERKVKQWVEEQVEVDRGDEEDEGGRRSFGVYREEKDRLRASEASRAH